MTYLEQLSELRTPSSVSLLQLAQEAVAQRTTAMSTMLWIRTAVECAFDPMVVADSTGRFVFWNERARQFSHMEDMETPPEYWSEKFSVYDLSGNPIPVEDLPLIKALKQRASSEGKFLVESIGRSRETLHIRANPVVVDGVVLGAVLWWKVVEDGTLKK